MDLPDDQRDGRRLILAGLKPTDCGRCVHLMSNPQPDHRPVNDLFVNGVTAALSTETVVPYQGRHTRIMGSPIEGSTAT